MNRDQLLRDLKTEAKDRKVDFEVFKNKGKGSHYRVKFGDRITTIKSGELSPTYVSLIKKQLGV